MPLVPDLEAPVVFVHLGATPKFLYKNLEYFAEHFQTRSKVIITDNEELMDFARLGYSIIKVQDLEIEWPKDFEIMGNKSEFRNNFWFSTKARLVILPKFMNVYKLQKLMHVESDVWLHPNFPFEKFWNIDAALAYPRVDKVRGIASVLLINGERGRDLLSSACAIWPHNTDMEILGRLLETSEDVFELPSTFVVEKNEFDDWIFDGAKLGMYLFGSDPRNNAGVIKRFRKSPLGSLPAYQEIALENDQVVLKEDSDLRKVANLHLHSKNRKMFSDTWQTILKRQIRKKVLRLDYGFDIYALVYWILEKSAQLYRKFKIVRLKYIKFF